MSVLLALVSPCTKNNASFMCDGRSSWHSHDVTSFESCLNCSDIKGRTFVSGSPQLGDLQRVTLQMFRHCDETSVLQELNAVLHHLPQIPVSTELLLLDVQQRPAQELSHLVHWCGDLGPPQVGFMSVETNETRTSYDWSQEGQMEGFTCNPMSDKMRLMRPFLSSCIRLL